MEQRSAADVRILVREASYEVDRGYWGTGFMFLGASRAEKRWAPRRRRPQLQRVRRTATLDPITSNETISLRITELVFNGLVGIDEKQEIVPELAERWRRRRTGASTRSPLRRDVKWHPREGEEARPFSADDVVFTYNIMMHPKTITPAQGALRVLEKIEKTGDYTVGVHAEAAI